MMGMSPLSTKQYLPSVNFTHEAPIMGSGGGARSHLTMNELLQLSSQNFLYPKIDDPQSRHDLVGM
jgi:hypothetical protein